MVKEKIQKLVEQKVFEFSRVKPQVVLIEKTGSVDFGEYTYNGAFALAKQQQKPPQVIAQMLVEELNKSKLPEIAKVEAVGGYINFFLSDNFVRQELARIYEEKENYGKSDMGRGRKIIVEYSQPNIAKPMHIGHLRNTVLGDALANILEFLGYKVIRWNYIGDWGTQFGKLIAAYKLWPIRNMPDQAAEAVPPAVRISNGPRGFLDQLVGLYVRFHQELKSHPELERRGQEEFRKLEQGDKENLKLWKWFREESLKEFEKTYKMLGVEFNETIGESFFEKELGKTVDWLMKDKIAEVGEENAKIIKLDGPNLPPALIQKGDGASLYLTRDIAALKYRLDKHKPAKMLYVVGNEQSLHFEQLFAVARILGWQQTELQHIKYGLVLGENKKKMSTREGEATPLTDLVKKAVELARKIVEEKNTDLSESEKQKIAETVGLGALKYEMLKEHRNSDIVFDWNKMLDLRGNSAPYLQYTYARLASILRKANCSRFNLEQLGELRKPSELAIIKHLIDFPDIIASTGNTYTTNHLALYLYELANSANRFYETVPVLKDEDHASRNAKLILIETTTSILKTGLGLLGIGVLEKI